MARNVEIKARIRDGSAMIALVENIADSGPEQLDQDDTFFNCPDGRLKLRELTPCRGQLILYHRPDVSGPKTSTYVIAETAEPSKMRQILATVLGEAGRVKKSRMLYMAGKTRIHIDNIEGLGSFLELEVVLDDSDSVEYGQNIAEKLLCRLGVQPADLIKDAYVDMLSVRNP